MLENLMLQVNAMDEHCVKFNELNTNEPLVLVKSPVTNISHWVDLSTFSDYEEFENFLDFVFTKDYSVIDWQSVPNLFKVDKFTSDWWDNFDEYYTNFHDTPKQDAYLIFCDMHNGIQSKEYFDECYEGMHDKNEFAKDYFLICNEIPDNIQDYIDWDKVADELFTTEFYEQNGHIFRNL
jgi:hypothetical protein